MDSDKIQEIAFMLILNSGDGRTLVHEAFQAMRKGDFEEAEQKLEAANNAIVSAHQTQTSLLQEYASGTKIEMEIIMVHAQDHLMTTMTLREVAIEMLELYKQIKNK